VLCYELRGRLLLQLLLQMRRQLRHKLSVSKRLLWRLVVRVLKRNFGCNRRGLRGSALLPLLLLLLDGSCRWQQQTGMIAQAH
jgi:hypothetical protein